MIKHYRMGMIKGVTHEGQFQKGQPSANPNGRPKGTKNKWSIEIKRMIKKKTGIFVKNLEDDLEKMSPKDRWTVISTMWKYVMPTMKDVKKEVSGNVNVQVNYQTRPKELPSLDDFKSLNDVE